MKTSRSGSFVVLAMAVVLALIPVSGICGQTPRIFEAPANSPSEYTGYTRATEYVAMKDGTKLATVRYVPSGGPAKKAFPVIFVYYPYHYEVINPKTGETQPHFVKEAVSFYTSHGYVLAIADMRGSGASYGTRVNFSPQLADDGKELVDWIAAQPWCDGKVGMIGVSYMGWSTYATAGRQPKALKCIIPGYYGFDAFTGTAGLYPGGIRQAGGLFGLWGPVFFDQNQYLPGYPSPPLGMPATPVIDEDGDGDLADEIPLDLNGNGSFLDDYQLPDKPPQYSDGKERQHLYYLMTLEHMKNPNVANTAMAFRDDPAVIGSDIVYDRLGQNDYPVRIAETGIPILHEGGWFDRYVSGQAQWYATLARTNPSGLVIGPTIHNWGGVIPASDPGPYIEYFGENKAAFIQGFQNMRLRFLDYHLKGIGSSEDTKSLTDVHIYVMNGEGWRIEKEWPLKRQKMIDYMFGEGNSLTETKSDKAQASDKYVADFTHDGRQSVTNSNRWGGVPTSVMTRTEQDKKTLIYTSGALDKDIEVTGHPIVRLWVSSTADYGDFFAYLEDVDESGKAYAITDGQLRAEFAKLVPNEDILPKGANIEILPDLPWHGYKKSDYADKIFANGNIAELTFDLFPTSWVFKKGHKIRVSIACADYPTFKLHPMLSPSNDPKDPNNIVPTVTIHRDKDHPSRIELPVIPPKESEIEDNSSSCFVNAVFGSSKIMPVFGSDNEKIADFRIRP